MFFRLFGNYLKDKSLLDDKQIEELMKYRRENRVKLGMLAVEQGLMTAEKADEVNRLQAVQDKRFGEIAIEKTYLTSADMDQLIAKQGNPYFLFLQAVQEKGFLSKDKLNELLLAYQEEKALNAAQLEIVKSGTADEVAEEFLKADNSHAENLIKLAIRNLVRFVSSDICFGNIVKTDKFEAAQMASQKIESTTPIQLALTSEASELLELACIYGKEEFDTLDADAYDAVCEFINCNNGLYARTHSTLCCELELLPPTFEEKAAWEGEIYSLDVCVNNKTITVAVKIG
jgi:hypothetical protein